MNLTLEISFLRESVHIVQPCFLWEGLEMLSWGLLAFALPDPKCTPKSPLTHSAHGVFHLAFLLHSCACMCLWGWAKSYWLSATPWAKKKKKCQHWILEKMVVSRHKYLGYCFLTKPSRQANKEFRWIVLMCAFGTPLIVSLKRPETPSFFSLVSNFLPSCYWGDISH